MIQIKASYVPMEVHDPERPAAASASVWIIPEWSEPVDPSAVNIILQPGVAFGTGAHLQSHQNGIPYNNVRP